MPQALKRRGHEVRFSTGDPHLFEQQLADYQPDLILSMGWTTHTTPAWVLPIRAYTHQHPALHLYWSVEDPIHTETFVAHYLKLAQPDALLTISPEHVAYYHTHGYPTAYLPFAMDRNAHRPGPAVAAQCTDIALVANFSFATAGTFRKTSLEWLLAPLRDLPVRVGIWGRHWEELAAQQLGFEIPSTWLRGPLSHRDVAQVYRSATIVLCPQNTPNTLTRRTFEALGCGAAVLAPRTPAVQEHFVEGEHLLCSASTEETRRQIATLLEDDRRRQLLGTNGRAQTLLADTFDHRAATLEAFALPLLAQKRMRTTVAITPPLFQQELPVFGTFREETARFLLPRDTLTLPAPVLEPPPGYRLQELTLRCFADTVETSGTALVIDSQNRRPLARQKLTAHGPLPYPATAGWCSFPLSADVAKEGRSFQLIPSEGLQVIWGQPGWIANDRMIRAYLQHFWPHWVVRWQRKEGKNG
ncbi:MAG: glycosyltransferase [Firmicutes bacterium]|nr:glycosyltransferase [Bacillota bacterium]